MSNFANGAFTLFGASNKKTLTTVIAKYKYFFRKVVSETYEIAEEDKEATKSGFVFPESMQMDFVYEDEEEEEEENNSQGYWAITKKIDNMQNLQILAELVAQRDNEALTNEFKAWADGEGAKLERQLLRKLKSL